MSLLKRMGHIAILCAVPKIVDAVEKLFTPDEKRDAERLDKVVNQNPVDKVLDKLVEKEEHDAEEHPVADPGLPSAGPLPDRSLSPTITVKKYNPVTRRNVIPTTTLDPMKVRKRGPDKKLRDSTPIYEDDVVKIIAECEAFAKKWDGKPQKERPNKIPHLGDQINAAIGKHKDYSTYSHIYNRYLRGEITPKDFPKRPHT